MVLWQVLPSFDFPLIYFRLKLHFTLTAERGQEEKVDTVIGRLCVEDLSPGSYFSRKTTPREEMISREVIAVNELKDMRWRQRFTNFERSYQLLAQYKGQEEGSELEQAGLIQFFEMSFELALKLMKDYLEAQQIYVNSPREAIKQSYQIDLIDDGHVWIDALTDRNRTVHTYNKELAKQMVKDIEEIYFPELEKLYNKLLKEL